MKYIVLVMIVIFYSGCSRKEKYTFYSTKTVDFSPYVKIKELKKNNDHVRYFGYSLDSTYATGNLPQGLTSNEHINNLLEEENALFYSSNRKPFFNIFNNVTWEKQKHYLWRYNDFE